MISKCEPACFALCTAPGKKAARLHVGMMTLTLGVTIISGTLDEYVGPLSSK